MRRSLPALLAVVASSLSAMLLDDGERGFGAAASDAAVVKQDERAANRIAARRKSCSRARARRPGRRIRPRRRLRQSPRYCRASPVPALLPTVPPQAIPAASGEGAPFPAVEPRRFGGGEDPEEGMKERVPVGPLVRAPDQGVDRPPPLQEETPPEETPPQAQAASADARAAVVGDVRVTRNISLKTVAPMPVAASLVAGDGGEQSVATDGRNTVIYTMNWNAAISLDGGRTFSLLSPGALFKDAEQAGGFCCDQVVTYIPSVDRFVWIVQYERGRGGTPNAAQPNLLRVATATSAELAGYDGSRWPGVWYDFSPSSFKSVKAPATGAVFLDRPFVAFTNTMLHFTVTAFNLGGTPSNGTLVWRVPIAQLGGRLRSRSAVLGGEVVRPAQNAYPSPSVVQFFGQRSTTSRLNIYVWPADSTSLTRHEVDVPSTGNTDLVSRDPAGNDWLARVGAQVSQVHTGAVTRDGTVWFGWLAGREAVYDVNGRQRREHVHDQPTIEFAGFKFRSNGRPERVDYETIEFEKYATALPELRANSSGDLGLSFMFGGPTLGPSHAVGFVRRDYAMALTRRNTLGAGGYGDYVALAQNPRRQNCFVAAGSSGMLPGDADPRYIVFGREATNCAVPSLIRPILLPSPTPIVVAPAEKPDLVIDRVYLTSDTGWLWNVVVRNAGTGPAPAGTTGLTQPQAVENPIPTPALAPGASATVTVACPYGSLAEATARADVTGAADESNEDNNIRAADPGGGTDGRCRYP